MYMIYARVVFGKICLILHCWWIRLCTQGLVSQAPIHSIAEMETSFPCRPPFCSRIGVLFLSHQVLTKKFVSDFLEKFTIYSLKIIKWRSTNCNCCDRFDNLWLTEGGPSGHNCSLGSRNNWIYNLPKIYIFSVSSKVPNFSWLRYCVSLAVSMIALATFLSSQLASSIHWWCLAMEAADLFCLVRTWTEAPSVSSMLHMWLWRYVWICTNEEYTYILMYICIRSWEYCVSVYIFAYSYNIDNIKY